MDRAMQETLSELEAGLLLRDVATINQRNITPPAAVDSYLTQVVLSSAQDIVVLCQ